MSKLHMTPTFEKILDEFDALLDEFYINRLSMHEGRGYLHNVVSKEKLKSFLTQALLTAESQGYRRGVEDAKVLIKDNRQGSFTDDAGNDCWYINELLTALDELLTSSENPNS